MASRVCCVPPKILHEVKNLLVKLRQEVRAAKNFPDLRKRALERYEAFYRFSKALADLDAQIFYFENRLDLIEGSDNGQSSTWLLNKDGWEARFEKPTEKNYYECTVYYPTY